MSTTTPPPASSPKPVSILFVCLGNICRSPMAEGVFRSQTHFGTSEQHPLIAHIDSCGTGAYHTGDSPDSRTMAELAAHGIRDYVHAARAVRVPQDLVEFDYILAMDADNARSLSGLVEREKKKGRLSGEEVGKIRLFGEFGGKGRGDEEIDDPYYGGNKGFRTAFEQVERFGKGLLKEIEARAGAGES